MITLQEGLRRFGEDPSFCGVRQVLEAARTAIGKTCRLDIRNVFDEEQHPDLERLLVSEELLHFVRLAAAQLHTAGVALQGDMPPLIGRAADILRYASNSREARKIAFDAEVPANLARLSACLAGDPLQTPRLFSAMSQLLRAEQHIGTATRAAEEAAKAVEAGLVGSLSSSLNKSPLSSPRIHSAACELLFRLLELFESSTRILPAFGESGTVAALVNLVSQFHCETGVEVLRSRFGCLFELYNWNFIPGGASALNGPGISAAADSILSGGAVVRAAANTIVRLAAELEHVGREAMRLEAIRAAASLIAGAAHNHRPSLRAALEVSGLAAALVCALLASKGHWEEFFLPLLRLRNRHRLMRVRRPLRLPAPEASTRHFSLRRHCSGRRRAVSSSEGLLLRFCGGPGR